VKVFSWSGLVYVLSISFIWSCGYWLLLQSGSWHLLQQKNELNQQLEQAQTLLQNWQQGYQLHLAYLENELLEVQQLPTAGVESALVDPLQQLDEQIRRVLWPDPLLAYAVLDAQGRALRLSSAVASSYFTQTNFQAATGSTFLPPLVLREQWILPLQVNQQQQRLVLWFDAGQLQEQLQRLMSGSLHSTEILLLDKDAGLLSHSRFQKLLLPRLGLDAQDPQQVLRIYAKRPPENLLRSKQRYQDAGAWPLTSLMAEIERNSNGFIATHYRNYLGRQTLASFRHLPDWQLYLVVERDAGPMLQELSTIKMRLLAALAVLTLLLSLVFYLIHRKLQRAAEAVDELAAAQPVAEWELSTDPHDEPPVLGRLDLTASAHQDPVEPSDAADPSTASQADIAVAVAGNLLPSAEPPTLVTGVPAAAALLQAWLQQPHLDPTLADISRSWLQQMSPVSVDEVWCSDLQKDLSRLLSQRHQADCTCHYLLEASIDFPEALLIARPRVLALLQSVLTQTELRIGAGTLLVRLMLAEINQLRIEIVDQSDRLSDGQWLKLLTPAEDDPAPLAMAYREIQHQLHELHAHLSARAELANGNKMVLIIPCEIPPQPKPGNTATFSGSAMLLCPAGEGQQLYRRLLRQSGLDLLPMDDASQLLLWCESSPQELSKMLIDEDFVKADPALAGKIASVVRRYFPQVQVLLIARQPQLWLELARNEQFYLLAKPLTPGLLANAFCSTVSGIVGEKQAKIWLYQPDPLQYWWVEQQLNNLHFLVQRVEQLHELPGDLLWDYYCLPCSACAELQKNDMIPKLVLWSQGTEPVADVNQYRLWQMADGSAVLSRLLYQLKLQQDGHATETSR